MTDRSVANDIRSPKQLNKLLTALYMRLIYVRSSGP